MHKLHSRQRSNFKGANPSLPMSPKPCQHCGRSKHMPEQCRFRQATCHTCGNLGHITPVCPSNPRFKKPVNYKQSAKPTHLIITESDSSSAASLYTISEHTSCSPYQVQLKLNSKPIVMEIDTGANF